MFRSMNCPNCGAPYNPAKYECESCGSFVIISDANQFTVPQKTVSEIAEKISRAEADPGVKYPGTYVFGKLLGEGEIPLRLGAANYYTSALFAAGGKLLLTGTSLYFSSHAFNLGNSDLCIPLTEITEVKHDRNQIVSDQISVYTGQKRHRFVVFGGKEWVEMIRSAKDDPRKVQKAAVRASAAQPEDDYTEELLKLKKLLDAGIITEEEFTIKKRMILGL